jgi:hypothetical protein
MNQPSNIDRILRSRDAALHALNDVMDEIDAKIAETTQQGPYLRQLWQRYEGLDKEYNNIIKAADLAILHDPDVAFAVDTLESLAAEMKKTAEEETDASKLLEKGTQVLSLSQRFSDMIAKTRGSAA